MKQIIAPAIAAAILASSGYAATITVTNSPAFAPTRTDLSGAPGNVVTVQKFDAASANVVCPPGSVKTLTGVSIHLVGGISSAGRLQNNSPQTETASAIFSGPFNVLNPADNVTVWVTGNASATFGPFTIPSGGSQTFGPSAGSPATIVNVTTGVPIAQFAGGGTINLPLTTVISQSIQGGGGNVTLLLNGPGEGTFANLSVEVIYTYECIGQTGGAPEPKTYGMIGAALSLGLLGYRQYRAKKA